MAENSSRHSYHISYFVTCDGKTEDGCMLDIKGVIAFDKVTEKPMNADLAFNLSSDNFVGSEYYKKVGDGKINITVIAWSINN